MSDTSDIFDAATVREEIHREAAIANARAPVNRPGREDCEDCGEEIPLQRRIAVPWAIRCLDCEAVHEIGRRINGLPR